VEWLEVRIVEQNECLSIKSRTEALDGDQFYYYYYYNIYRAHIFKQAWVRGAGVEVGNMASREGKRGVFWDCV